MSHVISPRTWKDRGEGMYEALGLVPGTLIAKHYASILDALVEKEALDAKARDLGRQISCAIMNYADDASPADCEGRLGRELEGVSRKIAETDDLVIDAIVDIAKLVIEKEHPTSGGDAFREHIAWVSQDDPMNWVCTFILGKAYELGLHDHWLMDRARMSLAELLDDRDRSETN